MLDSCLGASEHLCETMRFWDEVSDEKMGKYPLQSIEYEHVRKKWGLPSQVAIDLIKDTHAMFKGTKGIHSRYSMSFNVPRSGGFSTTKRGHPVVRVATLVGRLALPILEDGAYQRCQELLGEGYSCTAFRLQKNEECWYLLMSLKYDRNPQATSNVVVGVDVGSRTLATVVAIDLSTEKILEQHYLGRDVWERQRDFNIRRSKLQAFADNGPNRELARKKLCDLDKKEPNFVKTRCYQVAHEVVAIARRHGATIAIEELTYLHSNTRKNGKKSNRRTKRMPYRLFRVALESIAMRFEVPVVAVNPHNTSKWCPCCGSIGVRKHKGKLFYCDNCKRIINADRNAGLNIAIRAGSINVSPDFVFPESDGYGPVNGHVWQDEEGIIKVSQTYIPPDCKPTALVVGS